MNVIPKAEKIEQLLTIFGDFSPISGILQKEENSLLWEDERFQFISSYEEHESGIIKRCDQIKNISDQAALISSALSKFVFNGGEYEVYTQYSEWCFEGNGRWQPLVTEICASNDDVRMNLGSVPFFSIFNCQNHRGIAFHILCDSTWKFRVKKHFSQTNSQRNVIVELGLDDKNLAYSLQPGETLQLPTILYYAFQNKVDMDAYKLHRYCNDHYPQRKLPIIYNSWMSRFDHISYDILSEQLEIAKEIGAEYFTIDAGWFGEPNQWFSCVGDWEECMDASMAGRMAEFADKVRQYGLRFGLWFEIERADRASQAVKNYPEYFIRENDQFFVDFANPAARNHIINTLRTQINRYGIEFIKFDFNAELTFDRARKSFLDYFKGYRAFIRQLKEEFPALYLENCASGGMRMALSNLDGFDSFWMSDNHSLYRQLEIFKSALIRMPANALEKWITIRSIENFMPQYERGGVEKILVSGDAGWSHLEAVHENFLMAVAVGGPIGISCDLTLLSKELREHLAKLIADYKKERDDFWRKNECRILCDTESLLILQFNDRCMEKIKIYAYAKIAHQNAVTVYPVCDENSEYQLTDGSVTDGKTLAEGGIDIRIGANYTATEFSMQKKRKG